MKAPFPWFGGKSRIAPRIWKIVSPNVLNYVEPFGGSLAVLLQRPGWHPEVNWIETINDRDGFVANFWRAVKHDPRAVAMHADNPVNENDLHARHAWLIQQVNDLTQRLEADPGYYDAKIAGFWVWGVSIWIGHGFCSGRGPWQVVTGDDGIDRLINTGNKPGVEHKRPHLMTAGKGIARQLPFIAGGDRGVVRGTLDIHSNNAALINWMQDLSDRLKRVRVACGDWKRICTPAVTSSIGKSFIFLDPPYSIDAGDRAAVYSVDDGQVAHEVRAWCVQNGDRPKLMIILCGYRGEHDEDMIRAGWEDIPWKASGGYGSQGNGRGRANASREVLWINRAMQDLIL